MEEGIYSMTNEEKNFLKFYDAKEAIYEGDGSLRKEISAYNEKIIHFFGNSIVQHKVIEMDSNYIDFRDVFRVGNRFFAVGYTSIRKDMDEYIDFSYPVEVKQVVISKVVYEKI